MEGQAVRRPGQSKLAARSLSPVTGAHSVKQKEPARESLPEAGSSIISHAPSLRRRVKQPLPRTLTLLLGRLLALPDALRDRVRIRREQKRPP